ncbi:hypothetical protein ACJRO7_021166 [Eucalyptus globulus]|uniref:TIR domain-containing protein n=1 Tax=Eucalyptus globulus TaxID=34317 RepID=A0ABD3KIW9_EUCGL
MDMAKSSKAEIRGGEPLATDYEVFLNFRGPDTRQGFTDCLYHGMLDANICVFFDEEDLHIGKEIGNELSTAIEKSKIYIPIFSKGYASSAWCLHELAHMVECKKSKPSEKEILTIFYDVEPRDVKLKSELYVSALMKHEDMFGRQRRLKWEDALRSVAQIKGWELKNQGYWKFIKSVIQEIVMKLKTKDKYVAEHIVGMDEQVEAVVELLDVDSKVMRFVLIHGMGGIGKTTLAKVVFNKLNSLFSHCCFLGNVQELSLSFGLMTLQKQLLSDIFGSGFRDVINDVDDGIKMIAQRLSNKKVFIILDDVGNEEQLEKLAIKHISFSLGSKIIITTRNKSILKAYQTLEYEVKPLDSVQSLELFSRRAFKRNFPPDDYVSLSRQVVSTTGGLPLALEVIGSLLHHQNKALWIDVLNHHKEIPYEKQKHIFLDIACMFVDKDKTNASYMWKDCRFFPEYSIQVLVCMSLIKITDDNKFWMHDQLRDLGREIICGDTGLINLGRQSRLSCPDMAKNIIRTKEFSRLPNIRFLELIWGQLDGDFENQLSELRYMTWHLCPRELLAINFCPSNLVVLDLSNSFITEDWAGWSHIKVAKKLKVLDLTGCKEMTKTPDFSHHTSLERLILNGCSNLIEVDGSLEKLKCLIYFNANGCTSLRELPEGIGGLEKLEYLYLRNCKELRKLPKSFARVASLIELDLSYTTITRLPNSIGNQKHMSLLQLRCTEIEEIPSSLGNLQELKSLVLSYTKIRELPISIGNLESLQELDVSGTQFINISESLIRELPRSIVELKELEELHVEACQSLQWGIPEGIWELSLLRVLNLELTRLRNIPKTIKLLPRLERLGLYGCSELEVLCELPTSLISLSFGSSSLRWVENLLSLTKLANLSYCGHDGSCSLYLQDGPCRQSLAFLPPSLSTLTLHDHESITSLSFHCNLRNLTRLRIYQCRWKEVQLNGLEQLIEFEVRRLEFLEGFAGLSSLKRLKLLSLYECPNLTAIQGLASVESLEQLAITYCPKIESLDDLSALKRLKSLSIRGCEELLAVKGLDELETLKYLKFTDCRSLKSFLNVFNSKVPEECFLKICGCPNLEENPFEGRVTTYEECEVQEKRRKEKEERETGNSSATRFNSSLYINDGTVEFQLTRLVRRLIDKYLSNWTP